MPDRLPRDKYLVREELSRLFYAARTRPHVHARRDHALLVLLGLTGVRASELLALRWGDVAPARGGEESALVRVRRLKKRAPVVDEVGLPATAERVLTAYARTLPAEARAPEAPVFSMTRQNLWAIVKRYARIAGLNPRYTTHSLRHTRAVLLYEETRDALLVKESLGHANLETTMIYVHVVDGVRRAAAVDGFEAEAGAPT